MTTSTLATLTIGGEPQPGAAGTYPVHNPARPAEVVGEAPAASRAQLDAAVTAARNASAGWRALPVAERVAAVSAAAMTAGEQLKERGGARLYTSEHGKVLSEATFEMETGPMIAAVLGSMAEAALAPEQIDQQAPYPRLHREPYGVAALVIPFTQPRGYVASRRPSKGAGQRAASIGGAGQILSIRYRAPDRQRAGRGQASGSFSIHLR